MLRFVTSCKFTLIFLQEQEHTWWFCENVLTLDEHSDGAVAGGVDGAGGDVRRVESW